MDEIYNYVYSEINFNFSFSAGPSINVISYIGVTSNLLHFTSLIERLLVAVIFSSPRCDPLFVTAGHLIVRLGVLNDDTTALHAF